MPFKPNHPYYPYPRQDCSLNPTILNIPGLPLQGSLNQMKEKVQVVGTKTSVKERANTT
jgi:hypothetical protein